MNSRATKLSRTGLEGMGRRSLVRGGFARPSAPAGAEVGGDPRRGSPKLSVVSAADGIAVVIVIEFGATRPRSVAWAWTRPGSVIIAGRGRRGGADHRAGARADRAASQRARRTACRGGADQRAHRPAQNGAPGGVLALGRIAARKGRGGG